jgi:hypothetical protein
MSARKEGAVVGKKHRRERKRKTDVANTEEKLIPGLRALRRERCGVLPKSRII